MKITQKQTARLDIAKKYIQKIVLEQRIIDKRN